MKKNAVPPILILLVIAGLLVGTLWPVLAMMGNSLLGRVELRITPMPGCLLDEIKVNGQIFTKPRRTVVTYVPRARLVIRASQPNASGSESIKGEMTIPPDKKEMYMHIGCSPLRFVDDKKLKVSKP